MDLSPAQCRYLLVGQGVVPFAINVVLNGAIGYAAFAGVDPVPAWGVSSSAGPDLIGTCFFLPAITCLIVTPLVRRQTRSGLVERASELSLPAGLALFRRGLAVRALMFGLAGLAVAGGAVAAALLWAGPSQFGFRSFLWVKALFSGVLAAVVTPLIGLVALTEGSGDPARSSPVQRVAR